MQPLCGSVQNTQERAFGFGHDFVITHLTEFFYLRHEIPEVENAVLILKFVHTQS